MEPMDKERFHTYEHKSRYRSPRPAGELVALLLWQLSWALLCSWTPKPLNCWRLVWLKLFGAKLSGTPFVHQRARIEIPWNLTMHDRACLGDRANAYSLGEIELKARSTIGQEAYLCTGTHQFEDPELPLMTAKITIGEDVFIGVRAVILPGVIVGDGSVVGAGSLVSADQPEWTICYGNPCRPVKPRRYHRRGEAS